jgi:hypothetical protein
MDLLTLAFHAIALTFPALAIVLGIYYGARSLLERRNHARRAAAYWLAIADYRRSLDEWRGELLKDWGPALRAHSRGERDYDQS